MVPNQDQSARIAYFQMHLAILLYGFTAILGRLITLPGTMIVWYRMLITGLSLCLFVGIFTKVRQFSRSDLIKTAWIGVLMAAHWVAFFEAIKYSNVSITLSCFASMAFFTALIEPLVMRHRIRLLDIFLGILVVIGIVLIFGFSGKEYITGIILAIISAIIIAYAGVLNKILVGRNDVYALTLIEFAAGWLFLCPLFPLYLYFFPETPYIPGIQDAIYLGVLALICTTFAYTLTMRALKKVSAYSLALAFNLEPIYGMILAIFFFQENRELNAGFYVGALIILGSVFLYPVLGRRG